MALISDDVDWPDDDASRLHGKDEVRAYWTEQWARTRTHDEPVGFSERNDGRTAVHISQVVRSLDGPLISKGQFLHLHRIGGGRDHREGSLDIASVTGLVAGQHQIDVLARHDACKYAAVEERLPSEPSAT